MGVHPFGLDDRPPQVDRFVRVEFRGERVVRRYRRGSLEQQQTDDRDQPPRCHLATPSLTRGAAPLGLPHTLPPPLKLRRDLAEAPAARRRALARRFAGALRSRGSLAYSLAPELHLTPFSMSNPVIILMFRLLPSWQAYS